MAKSAVTCISIITEMPSLPSGRITSKICSLTSTLDIKDNPSPDTLLSDNSSNFQETAAILSLTAGRGIYSACACLVSKSHNKNVNIN